MSLEVLEKADCEAMGMGCFLGVAECSAEPLKFVHLTYKPKGRVASDIFAALMSPKLKYAAECPSMTEGSLYTVHIEAF